jgi:O-antigen/teichoic acid export membrane protein
VKTIASAEADAAVVAAPVPRVARNMVIVAGSLLATWSVALMVRLVLPRSLGPALFGRYSFAEALAIDGFAFVGLGIDIYVQKEIPRRPEHASDFFAGTQAVQLASSVFVFGAIALIAHRAGYSATVVGTALALGLAQLCNLLANTCATLLYAARSVGRLSALNIASKLVWAGGVAIALVERASLWAFALAAVASESIRLAVLYRLAREVTGVRVRFDFKETFAALKRSSPYWINQVAIVLYAKIDVAIMGVLVTDRELGYYGAATNVSSVAMLMSPFMGWVLTPELSRTVHDKAAFSEMLRRALEWTLTLAIPIAMMLGLGADVIVHAVFGSAFAPSIVAMRTLMPIFVFVYVAMLGATALILRDRSWTVTTVTLVSLAVNAGLNVLVVRAAWHAFGTGGAGIGAAWVSVATEAAVGATYVFMLRRDMLDARNVKAALKSFGACGAVVAFHFMCPNWGPIRLALDAALYATLVVSLRAVRVSELVMLVRSVSNQRGSHANS